MKKFLFVLGIIVIIAVIILWMRGCESAKRPAEEVDLSVYRDLFILANTEFTCLIVKNPSFAEDQGILKENLAQIYNNHGFPVEDNGLMIDILDLYENDEEVIAEIKSNVTNCTAQ